MIRKKWWAAAAMVCAIGTAGAQDHAHQHHAATAADTRQAIVLAPAERALILTEMRHFLGAVQVISEALAQDDFERAAAAAGKMGIAAAQEVPAGVAARLPVEFRQLGRSTHLAFDQLALDAGEVGDTQHSLQQLGKLLSNCNACHALFRLESAPPR